MRTILVLMALMTAASAQSTKCTTIGKDTSCTTTPTTDWNAVGQNLGAGLRARVDERRQWDFCHAHPGQVYEGQVCRSWEQQAADTAVAWMGMHHKYAQTPANGTAMAGYIEANGLDPRLYKSYDRAFKELKKQGRVAVQ